MSERKDNKKFPLDGYRVLDLTDEKGYMCGQILGGLGADVIKVEPPGGDKGRSTGPFYADCPAPEKSLFWFAANTNKKSITLNISTRDGGEILKKLIKTADFLIESFEPGYLDKLGLGYGALSRINPRLIMTSITPFGQAGPRSGFKGPDIVCWASSGYMWLSGDADRAPLRTSLPQAYFHGGAEGAMGSMVAFWHRQMSGEGQHVDVSIQECIMFMCLSAQANWDMNQVILKREGAYRVYGPYRIKQIYRCKDGYVIFMLMGGHVGARGQRALTKWMDREGMATDFLKKIDWDAFDFATYDDKVARQLEPQFEDFFLTKSKEELFTAARDMGFLLAPVNTMEDMFRSPQFKAREYWVDIEHPELGARLTYPGAPFKSTENGWKMTRPPRIGEHNLEIYEREIGLSKEELTMLKGSGVI